MALVLVHPALMVATLGGGLAYALYRVVADSGKVVVGWREVAEQLGLSIERDGSRIGVALQLTNYAPQLHGTYRGVDLKVYISSAGVEAVLDDHDESAWRRFRGLNTSTSSQMRNNTPVTVFEAPLPDELNGRYVVQRLERMQHDAVLRENSVAFKIRGVLSDPEEVTACIEDLVASVNRSRPS